MPRFNRAYKGLYGNRMIQFGNKISFAENKSRRTWKPNVQKTTVFSETLKRKLTFRMTTYAMRCMRKAGGIDEYLVKTRDDEIKYDKAIALKQEIIKIKFAKTRALRQAGIELPAAEPDVTKTSSGKQSGSHDHEPKLPLKPTKVASFRSKGLSELLD